MGSGPTPQTQQSFTNQTQQQQGRSESQPASFVQGPLQGITADIYKQYTGMPNGNPVPDPSANTQGFWTGALNYGNTGMGGGAIDPLRDAFVANTLNGTNLDLSRNPYFQDALGASLQAPTENFVKNIIPGLKGTFASAGRPGSGAESETLQQAITNFGRTTNEAAAQFGNQAWQQLLNQQTNVASMLPSFQGMDLARLGLMGQAGQQQDAYRLMQNMGPMDFSSRAAMGILGAYPGGVTDSTGSSTGSGSTFGSASSGGGGGFGSIAGPIMSGAGLALQALPLFGLSDRRDKTDVEELGIDPLTGFKTYAYRYKDAPKNTPKVVGPMAQDIEAVRPDLVREIGGHKVVAMSVLRPSIPPGGLL